MAQTRGTSTSNADVPEVRGPFQPLESLIAGSGRLSAAAEKKLHAQLRQFLTPAIDRFDALDTNDERENFRKKLTDFVRAHSLLAQIVDWGDPELERLYQYGTVLLIRLPGRPATSVDIGDADLTHFRLEFTGQHNASLSPSGDRTSGGTRPTAAATGRTAR